LSALRSIAGCLGDPSYHITRAVAGYKQGTGSLDSIVLHALKSQCAEIRPTVRETFRSPCEVLVVKSRVAFAIPTFVGKNSTLTGQGLVDGQTEEGQEK
jgi:hypothetical protein